MKLPTVFLLDADAYASVFGPEERRALAAWIDVARPPIHEGVAFRGDPRLREVQAIISGWGVPRMDAEFLADFPALRIVFHAAGSVKSLVTDEFWRRGIRVTCAVQANAVPVAEFALSQVIFCLKHGWQRAAEVRQQRLFRKLDDLMPGAYRSTVGLVSLSHTGRHLARLLQQLEVEVIAYDPLVDVAEAAALGVRLMPLDDVFRLAHVVSCHAPLLPETVGLLQRRHFELMRPGASFINTARGAIVKQPDLIEVFTRRSDLFAVLDVTDPEPPELNSPLLALPNVVVTPHIAGSLGPECRRMAEAIIGDVRRYQRNESLAGEVFPERLAKLA